MATTSEDAWILYRHYLKSGLLAIKINTEIIEEKSSKEAKERAEKSISSKRAEMVGKLYMLRQKTKTSGHIKSAAKMKQLLDITVKFDLKEAKNRDLIHKKCDEVAYS